MISGGSVSLDRFLIWEPMPAKDQPFADFFDQNPLFRKFVAGWFDFSQRMGFDILPHHFYQAVPNIRDLRERDWDTPSSLPGLDLKLARQGEFLENVVAKYREELMFPDDSPDPAEFTLNNGHYQSCDAEILYCMVRHFTPSRIVEIGSGNSTRLAARALAASGLLGKSELFAIEPFPEPVLKQGFPGLTGLIEKKVQDMDPDFFSTLRENDILFIDSSHVVKTKNDVVFEYLEILPRLAPGVLVHIHDIYLPWDYPKKSVVDLYKFWSEQYLLQAFLTFNSAFEVVWSAAAMARIHTTELEAYCPRWKGSFKRIPAGQQVSTANVGDNILPCSFWIRRTTPPIAAS